MTEQRAIEVLEYAKNHYDEMGYGAPKIAVDMAINALEKQIAKKPIDTDWLYCPNCKVTLKVGLEKYCEHCGQRLNWEEE